MSLTRNTKDIIEEVRKQTRCTVSFFKHDEGGDVIHIQPVFEHAGPTKDTVEAFAAQLQNIANEQKLSFKVHIDTFSSRNPVGGEIYKIRIIER